jgi:hypothetical protein
MGWLVTPDNVYATGDSVCKRRGTKSRGGSQTQAHRKLLLQEPDTLQSIACFFLSTPSKRQVGILVEVFGRPGLHLMADERERFM